MSTETEILLAGGRTTANVVRVGDTVRRPQTQNSNFVRLLLGYLENEGFDAAPRALGVDEQGREMFSYLDGEVPSELSWHDDEILVDAARLIRRYHDATCALVESATGSVISEIVCHNDLSPCNFVFRSNRPVALIDFDAAAPGTRQQDIGYALWMWLDLGNADIPVIEQRRRMDLFLEAYDMAFARMDILDAIVLRQQKLAVEGERVGNLAMAQWAHDCLHWMRQNMRSS